MKDTEQNALADMLRARGWRCIPPAKTTDESARPWTALEERAIRVLMWSGATKPEDVADWLELDSPTIPRAIRNYMGHVEFFWQELVTRTEQTHRPKRMGPKRRPEFFNALKALGLHFGMSEDDPLIVEARRRLGLIG